MYTKGLEFRIHCQRIAKEHGEKVWHGEVATICSTRLSGLDNKHFYRELLFDGTPEEYEEFVEESFKNSQEKGVGLLMPIVPEMVNVIQFIMEDSNRKIKEEEKVRMAIENFAIDFLSTIKPYSPRMPKYAKKNFDVLYGKLIEELYSNRLSTTLLVPISCLHISGPKIELGKNICIRELKETETFDLTQFEENALFRKIWEESHDEEEIQEKLYALQTESRGEYSPSSCAVEMTKNIHREVFDGKFELQKSDYEFITEIIDIVTLFKENTPSVSEAFLLCPVFKEIPALMLPLESFRYETRLELTIEKDDRRAFVVFVKDINSHLKSLYTDPKIRLCYNFYRKALDSGVFEYKLLNCVIGFEVLFGSNGRDTAHWISLRAAKLLGVLSSERADVVLNDIRATFAARNEFMHNGILKKGTKSTTETSMPRLIRYLRKSIVCFLFLRKNLTYDGIITAIDTAVESISIQPSKDFKKISNRMKSARF